ncbi:ABC transporter ATP-binding protein [Ottowia sp.]|uniref:ABC transporter ATP-binding protein n=1 Tax=Ottowia sp. TaxID=1898956 RepID=UPI002C266BF7|nr:ABC transporter ATP-binding protein [Ottowia sp.]HRN76974.1 ABC transporter ATP-binding protein [Ottowia sp.]HRQ04094.1 ABC transporter ATP-binding protein [Ottowia sp.]
MLIVEDLHTYYGESHALQGVSLRVEAGEVVCLLGRNGAGKSTTLGSIIGLTPARRGSIRFDGQEIRERRPHWITRHGIALVPEDRRIFAGLSVTENLEVAAPRQLDRERRWPIERLFETFPMLAEVRHQDGATLSGGQRQMLAIARALASEPRLLLLDEPNEGLAPVIVQQIGALIEQLAQTTTILLTDQNVRFALRHARRGYVLQKGRVVWEGSARQIATDPEVQRYLTVA